MSLRAHTGRRHNFTLVEMIMAMVCLLLIMGAFTKILSGVNKVAVISRGKTDMYEKQRLFFDIVERDLQGLTVSDADGVELTCRLDSAYDEYFFVTSSGLGVDSSDSAVLAEVGYRFDSGNKTLYRDYSTPSSAAFNCLGDSSNGYIWANDWEDNAEIFAGVDSMAMQAYPVTHNTMTAPTYVDITLVLTNDEEEAGWTDTFTRRIYLEREF